MADDANKKRKRLGESRWSVQRYLPTLEAGLPCPVEDQDHLPCLDQSPEIPAGSPIAADMCETYLPRWYTFWLGLRWTSPGTLCDGRQWPRHLRRWLYAKPPSWATMASLTFSRRIRLGRKEGLAHSIVRPAFGNPPSDQDVKTESVAQRGGSWEQDLQPSMPQAAEASPLASCSQSGTWYRRTWRNLGIRGGVHAHLGPMPLHICRCCLLAAAERFSRGFNPNPTSPMLPPTLPVSSRATGCQSRTVRGDRVNNIAYQESPTQRAASTQAKKSNISSERLSDGIECGEGAGRGCRISQLRK